jgi:hypothetical protein
VVNCVAVVCSKISKYQGDQVSVLAETVAGEAAEAGVA